MEPSSGHLNELPTKKNKEYNNICSQIIKSYFMSGIPYMHLHVIFMYQVVG